MAKGHDGAYGCQEPSFKGIAIPSVPSSGFACVAFQLCGVFALLESAKRNNCKINLHDVLLPHLPCVCVTGLKLPAAL